LPHAAMENPVVVRETPNNDGVGYGLVAET